MEGISGPDEDSNDPEKPNDRIETTNKEILIKKQGQGGTIQRSVAFDLSEEEELSQDCKKKNGEEFITGVPGEILPKKKDSTAIKREIVGILKPPNPKKELKSFPSLPECFLHDLGLIEKGSLSTEHLSGQDIEHKFSSLSLAFKTDRVSLQERMELQQRQRDIAERNVEEEIRYLKTSIGTLNRMCQDSETREVLERVTKQIHVLQQSSGRVSSSAEVYGAVQQESRVAGAIEIMLIHVDNLKRIYEKEHHELQESRRILVKNKLLVDDSRMNVAVDKGSSTERNRSVSVVQSSSCKESPKVRRASLASTAHKQTGTNVQDQILNTQQLQKNSIRKIGISSASGRKATPDETFRNTKNEPVVSHFTPIQEHVEDGKDEEIKGLCGEDITNNNDSFSISSGIKKRESRKSSRILDEIDVQSDTFLEEIDALATRRDSSPIHHIKTFPETAEEFIRRKRSIVLHLKEWYKDFYWPFDQDETILGLRYCVTGILLTAAFLLVTVTFIGQSSKKV